MTKRLRHYVFIFYYITVWFRYDGRHNVLSQMSECCCKAGGPWILSVMYVYILCQMFWEVAPGRALNVCRYRLCYLPGTFEKGCDTVMFIPTVFLFPYVSVGKKMPVTESILTRLVTWLSVKFSVGIFHISFILMYHTWIKLNSIIFRWLSFFSYTFTFRIWYFLNILKWQLSAMFKLSLAFRGASEKSDFKQIGLPDEIYILSCFLISKGAVMVVIVS